MQLCALAGEWSRIEATPAVDTPLGRITLRAALGAWSIDAATSEAYENAVGSRVLTWDAELGRAELLLCRPALDLPEHLAVTDCWAGLWRVSPSADVDSCAFEARWEPGYRWNSGGADSGEGLDAQTWTDGVVSVSVGTQDGEVILARSQEGDGLPKTWGSAAILRCINRDCADLVRYEPTSLIVPLPRLRISEQAQIHFAIAWAPDVENDASTWYAVDLQQAQILDRL
jgi:hypothetical protein